MSIFVFAFYLILFSFLITGISFFKKSGLNKYWLIGLFILKVAAGTAYGWFYSQPPYLQGSDTWHFFTDSTRETDWLLRDPLSFIKDLFTYGYQQSGSLFNGENSYWNDLKSNIIIKLMAVINVLTFKSYYADVIFFNFIFFFGPVAFYRVVAEKFNARKLLLILLVFCIPSFLFWCSGMHKDGFIFMAAALIIFYFNKYRRENKVYFSSILIIFLCFILLFCLRNFVLILLLPALLTWFLCEYFQRKKWLITVAVYGLCIVIFFIAPLIDQRLNFPAYIVSKQNEFKALGGNSQLKLPHLTPSFKSFVDFFPYAFDVAVLRPHVSETNNIAYWPAIAENILLYLMLLFFLFKISMLKNKMQVSSSVSSFTIFCFCFALSNLLLCGYTITLTGAIVRYRSFVLPLIAAPIYLYFQINKKRA